LALERKEALHLAADGEDVAGDLLTGQEIPLLGPATRVADHAGGPADDQKRTVAGSLEMGQAHDRHQVAQVQAVRCRIEASVEGNPLVCKQSRQGVVAALGNKASLLEHLEYRHHQSFVPTLLTPHRRRTAPRRLAMLF
jgi:hypothetical protein